MADYTFLDLIPQFSEQELAGWHEIAGVSLGHPVVNPGGHVTLSHVVFGLFSVVLILVLAALARRKYSNREEALLPEGRFSIRNFFELIFDAVYNMMRDMMGEHHARRWFPLVATLAVFILISNLMGLVPGMIPPTQNLNTNLAPALVVFLAYNVAGIREHGVVSYLKHFAGPVWWLFFLMIPIELMGHIFRPISLGVRLTGNMTGDHMVLGVFGGLAENIFGYPALLPLPFLVLGLLVSVIQTLVFCLLSSVYISLSVAHEEH